MDELAWLDAYNPVWTSPSANASESMCCGGGDIGLNVWVEDGELLIYLARSGTFDELNTMPKLGRLRITLDSAALKSDSFRQELILRDGFVRISAGNATIAVWVDVFAPKMHVEIQSATPTHASVAYECWRLAPREIRGMETHNCRSWTSAPEPAIEKPHVVQFAGDRVRFHHRNEGRTAFDLCVDQQKLTSVRDRLWNPLEHLTFGGELSAEGFVAGGTSDGSYANTAFRAWNLRSKTARTTHRIEVVTHVAQSETIEAWNEELRANADRKSDRAKTIRWWNDFWQRSHIVTRSESRDETDPVWQIGRNYQVFRYQLGCNAFGDWPTKFNGGLFTVDPSVIDEKRAFSPDFRLWGGGSFTAQNQRLVYWPMLKSGDVELMTPQFEFYRRALVNAVARAKNYWNLDGACFTEQTENFALPVGFEYGWKRTADVEDGIEDNKWVNYQWDTVFEFCLMILDARSYANVDITKYVPLIEGCLAFYDAFYRDRAKRETGSELDADGKLRIFPGTSCETYKDALNPTPTIAALDAVLRAMLALPDEAAIDRARCSEMLAKLPAIAFRDMDGHRTISPAWSWSRKQNCELPQLYPVYPYGQFGVGRPDLDVARDTWHHGADAPDQKQIASWHQDAIFCARLGLTDEASTLTLAKMKDAPRRFPTFWGPGHDWVPDHNWGGSGMIGMQEMLLQAVDEKLYLLPAWPHEWDVDFKLHAPMQTTIECTVRNGTITSLRVTPESRRADIILPSEHALG